MPVHNHDKPKQSIEVEHDGKSVTGWDYQCPIGARTISTCLDEASVIWFLAYAKYNNYKHQNERKSSPFFDGCC